MFLINPFIYGAAIGSSYLVDDYSPVVAYSVDKISSTATVCCRVRRASDNAEQDIGFSGNRVDVAEIETFVGTGNNAYLVKVYNQGTGGSTYDASQSVASSQQTLVYSVSPPYIITTPGGISKPPLDLANNLTFSNLFCVAKIDTYNTANYVTQNASPFVGLGLGGTGGGVNGFFGYDGVNIRSSTGEDLNENLAYFNMKSSNLYVAKNGGTESSVGSFASSMLVDVVGGGDFNTGSYLKGRWKEMIFFNSDETANKTAIETNINDRFSIY